jgi:hypothetical protein
VRAATFGLFLTLVACVSSAVAATSASDAAQAGCGPNLVFLVWPHGHPAIPRYSEFPHVPNPHVELYVGTKGYDATYAGAWIMGGTPPRGSLAAASSPTAPTTATP